MSSGLVCPSSHFGSPVLVALCWGACQGDTGSGVAACGASLVVASSPGTKGYGAARHAGPAFEPVAGH